MHQLRVGIRRLRSTLRVFRALVRRRRAARLDKELRATLRALGPARDWDVLLQSRVEPVLQRAAHSPRAAAQRSVRLVLGHARFISLLRRTLAWAKSEPWRANAEPDAPLSAFSARALRRLHGTLRRDVAKIDWTDPARRHRVRILVKRLRYGSDCFAAAWPAAAMAPYLKQLRRLQEILGELNDIAVQRRLLGDIASADAARQARALARRLGQRERGLMQRLRRAWRAFEAASPYWRKAAVTGLQ